MEQGGKKAVRTGKGLEKFIERALIDNGYELIEATQFKTARYLEQPIYSKQICIGKSIYGENIYCDYILYHPSKWPECLIIEAKWQQRSGSVDEKFPYFLLNIQEKYPCKTILVLDGGGYKKGAEQWIRNQTSSKLLKVFNMSEFQRWVNNSHL